MNQINLWPTERERKSLLKWNNKKHTAVFCIPIFPSPLSPTIHAHIWMTSERSDPSSMRSTRKMHWLNRSPVTDTEFRTGHVASESAHVISRVSEMLLNGAVISIQTYVNKLKTHLLRDRPIAASEITLLTWDGWRHNLPLGQDYRTPCGAVTDVFWAGGTELL